MPVGRSTGIATCGIAADPADGCASRRAYFGANPTYVGILEKSGIVPGERFDLSCLKSVLLAGSPVTAEVMTWMYRNVKSDVWPHQYALEPTDYRLTGS